MKSYNEELAKAFKEIGDLTSLKGENPFKVSAYYGAARRLEQDLHPITKKETKASLMKIPRVGEALAGKMIEYMEKGKIDYLEKLRHEIPKAVRDMLQIPHLGPRRVRELYINLGIKSKKELIKHAKSGAIGDLPGFGDKLVDSIIDALKKGQEKKKRHNRKDIEPTAKKLIALIEKIKGVKKVEIAGSYRRGAKTVGDLDILVVGPPRVVAKAEKQIYRAFPKHTVLASGETKIAFVLFPDNLQVDIRFVPEESYGAALLYFTGSKEFNVMMRKVAIDKGYMLNEYGLFDSGEYIVGKTEKEVFEKLDLPITPPEKRK